MKTKTILILAIILFTGISAIFAQTVTDTTVVDYKIIDRTVRQKMSQYGTGQVLVVMDIDNTILISDTDLGGDFWYQWQNDELTIKPKDNQKLAKDCLYQDAIGLLYELGTMSLTDTLLPGYIGNWQKEGVTLFALTSRSPDYRAATERELRRNGIDLRKTELKTAEGKRIVMSDSLKRKFSYLDGIMMTQGMSKGEMLAAILDTAGISFRSIIFVDDTPKHLDSVYAHRAALHTEDLVLFHYTKILTERLQHNHDVVFSNAQARKMDHDWDRLIRRMDAVFPGRRAKSPCGR